MTRMKRSLIGGGVLLALMTLGGCSKGYHIGHRSSWYGGSFGYWYSKKHHHHGHSNHHHHHGHHGHHGGSNCY